MDIENVLLYMIWQVTAFARKHEDEVVEMVTKSNARANMKFVKARKNTNNRRLDSASSTPLFKNYTKTMLKVKSAMSVFRKC